MPDVTKLGSIVSSTEKKFDQIILDVHRNWLEHYVVYIKKREGLLRVGWINNDSKHFWSIYIVKVIMISLEYSLALKNYNEKRGGFRGRWGRDDRLEYF